MDPPGVYRMLSPLVQSWPIVSIITNGSLEGKVAQMKLELENESPKKPAGPEARSKLSRALLFVVRTHASESNRIGHLM